MIGNPQWKIDSIVKSCCVYCKKELETNSQGIRAHLGHCESFRHFRNYGERNYHTITREESLRITGIARENRLARKLTGRTWKEYYLQEVLVYGKWSKNSVLKEALVCCEFVKDTSCQKCGWKEMNSFSKSIPTELHHIDGDHCNCVPINLLILCPNCHSLTENYCGHGVKRLRHRGETGKHTTFRM